VTRAIVEVSEPGLAGRLVPPGDKSISHRVLLLALVAQGTSVLKGVSQADDVARTRRLIGSLGAEVIERPGALEVKGVGLGGLVEPTDVCDLGNSGTGVRLGMGIAALLDGAVVLTGDASLRQRPMARVAEPLRAMGARIDGRARGDRLPLVVRGGGLVGTAHRLPVASAQAKSAVLLAGLGAEGVTEVVEPKVSRRHTEELLAEAGVALAEEVGADGSHRVRLEGPQAPRALDMVVPGDPSAAAPLVAAAAACPGAALEVGPVYLGAERTGFLRVLARMGADLEWSGETIRVRGARLRATTVAPEEVPSLLDEVPALAVAFALAEGVSVVTGAEELAVKESDRRTTTVAMLEAFGVEAGVRHDGLWVKGGIGGGARRVESAWDHRIVMAAAACTLAVGGRTVIEGADAVITSFPEFFETLGRLGACEVTEEGRDGARD